MRDHPGSLINNYLITDLAMSGGLSTVIRGQPLWYWVGQGAVDEDVPFTLVRFHFYDPTTKKGLRSGVANSMYWAYQGLGNTWSWLEARDAFARSITAATPAERDTQIQMVFTTLGHVVHLLEDAAQPQHTRCDDHLSYFPGSPFEEYCATNYGTQAQLAALGTVPIPSFSVLYTNPPHGIPPGFASFWDTNQYHGQADFAGFSGTPGMAEISNYYFVSDDTMFTDSRPFLVPGGWKIGLRYAALDDMTSARYRYPSIRQTNIVAIAGQPPRELILTREGDDIGAPGAGQPYVQLTLTSGSVSIPNFCTALLPTPTSPGQIGLTGINRDAHARYLLPRAISYSTALMNYFFRARLSTALSWDAGRRMNSVQVRNDSPQALGTGAWSLYREDFNGNRALVPDTVSMYSGSLAVNASFSFLFPENLCVPVRRFLLFFQGTVGDETASLAVKAFNPANEVWTGPYSLPACGAGCTTGIGTATTTYQWSNNELLGSVAIVQQDGATGTLSGLIWQCSGTSLTTPATPQHAGVRGNLTGDSFSGEWFDYRCQGQTCAGSVGPLMMHRSQ